jgi:hypothetical protein
MAIIRKNSQSHYQSKDEDKSTFLPVTFNTACQHLSLSTHYTDRILSLCKFWENLFQDSHGLLFLGKTQKRTEDSPRYKTDIY